MANDTCPLCGVYKCLDKTRCRWVSKPISRHFIHGADLLELFFKVARHILPRCVPISRPRILEYATKMAQGPQRKVGLLLGNASNSTPRNPIKNKSMSDATGLTAEPSMCAIRSPCGFNGSFPSAWKRTHRGELVLLSESRFQVVNKASSSGFDGRPFSHPTRLSVKSGLVMKISWNTGACSTRP